MLNTDTWRLIWMRGAAVQSAHYANSGLMVRASAATLHGMQHRESHTLMPYAFPLPEDPAASGGAGLASVLEL